MDTLYKQQLCNKLNTITALERSGYGIPREEFSAREETKRAIAFVCALAAFVVFCSILALA